MHAVTQSGAQHATCQVPAQHRQVQQLASIVAPQMLSHTCASQRWSLTAKRSQQACHAAPWSQQLHYSDFHSSNTQQPFASSSGLHRDWLHAQQQQVTQLWQTQPQQQQNHSSTDVRQQVEQQGPESTCQEHAVVHHCISHAAAAAVVEQSVVVQHLNEWQEHGRWRPRNQQQQQHGNIQHIEQHPWLQHSWQHGDITGQHAHVAQSAAEHEKREQRPADMVMQQEQAIESGTPDELQSPLLQEQERQRVPKQEQQRPPQQRQPQMSQQQHPPPNDDNRMQRLARITHPAQITSWITHSQSFAELQQLHQHHAASFNPMNMSAMLVKLARLVSASQHQCGGDTQQAMLAGLPAQQIAVLLAHALMPRLHECQSARQAANSAWALAVMQCQVPSNLLQQAANQLVANAGQQLHASQPQELAVLAWALVKLQHNPQCEVWQHLVTAAVQQVVRFKPGELAMLLWALAVQQQWQQQAGGASGTSVSAAASQQHEDVRKPHCQSLQQSQGQQNQQHQECQQPLPQQQPLRAQPVRFLQVQRLPQPRLQPHQHLQQQPSPLPLQSAGDNKTAGPQGSSDVLQLQAAQSATSSHGANTSQQGNSKRSSKDSRQQAVFQQQRQTVLVQSLLSRVHDALQQEHGLLQYKPKELAMLLWACAVLGHKDGQVVQALAYQLQNQLSAARCNSQDVAVSLWALCKLQQQHPQLLVAASKTTNSWICDCSLQELALVLYSAGAAFGQLQYSWEPDAQKAVAHLWQQGVGQVQQRVSLGRLGCAEATTLLRAAALVLQPKLTSLQKRQHQQQQHQQQQQQQHQQHQQHQQQQQQEDQAHSSAGNKQEQGQQQWQQWQSAAYPAAYQAAPDTPESEVASSSNFHSLSSVASLASGSWDVGEQRDDITAAARLLVGAVDAQLCKQPQLHVPARYVACMLASFAAAGVQPSQQLRSALLMTAQAAASAMNRQQLCLAAWAAAKLSGTVADDEVSLLIEAIELSAHSKLAGMQPQQLSMLAWAHARLWNLGDSLMMHELARAAVQQLPRFGPQALSNLTWAFARARHYDGALSAALARRTRQLLGEFAPQELSNVVWGLVTLRYRQPGLLGAVARHAAAQAPRWEAKACVRLAVAYCAAGMPSHRYKGLLRSLADALVNKPGCLSQLTPHELMQLAVSYAAARCRHKQLAGQLAAAAYQQLQQLALVDVVQLIWALACLNQCHKQLLDIVSTRVAAAVEASDLVQGAEALRQQVPAAAGTNLGSEYVACSSTPTANATDGGNGSPTVRQAAGAASSASNSSIVTGSNSSSLSAADCRADDVDKLRPVHFARLAWAYKGLGHVDAAWYLMLARQAAGSTSSEKSRSHGGGAGAASASSNGAGVRTIPSSNSSQQRWHHSNCSDAAFIQQLGSHGTSIFSSVDSAESTSGRGFKVELYTRQDTFALAKLQPSVCNTVVASRTCS
eukprot:GHRR01002388.1.p1 GENE.GHRR01002388.1~~GHRR01002388.1.p1  ORF type:complete len:1444 (+),score=739.38 GHRR01002388.1:386-4717(+)